MVAAFDVGEAVDAEIGGRLDVFPGHHRDVLPEGVPGDEGLEEGEAGGEGGWWGWSGRRCRSDVGFFVVSLGVSVGSEERGAKEKKRHAISRCRRMKSCEGMHT